MEIVILLVALLVALVVLIPLNLRMAKVGRKDRPDDQGKAAQQSGASSETRTSATGQAAPAARAAAQPGAEPEVTVRQAETRQENGGRVTDAPPASRADAEPAPAPTEAPLPSPPGETTSRPARGSVAPPANRPEAGAEEADDEAYRKALREALRPASKAADPQQAEAYSDHDYRDMLRTMSRSREKKNQD
ncbi:hypothetical protein J31TS4_02390 [Paenibacillus sp. J31TS4]|uniref:hypothetical protein n=1 Tax=Paenibacillus sp. J31TS4 TaxID=2807195 RepID=UPI001B0D0C0B|nr:hypothetical protein [Paenibacillus sp. J31TS4]GIP36959.1 hypothetical protein J31TS4_02390 [Paenibacillus sp. J31TS4]